MSLSQNNTTFSTIHNIINNDIYLIKDSIDYYYTKNYKYDIPEPSKPVLVQIKESYYNKTPNNRRYKLCSPMGLGRCRK